MVIPVECGGPDAGPEPVDCVAAIPELDLLFDSATDESDAQAGAGIAHAALTESLLRQACQAALSAQQLLDMRATAVVQLSVQLVDEKAMQALNRDYRGKDKPTNVLSFASGLPPVPLGDEVQGPCMRVLGDIVLCGSVVLREAMEQNKKLEHHWVHLLVHGTLHLCGYDHEIEAQAEVMETMEIQILAGLGIPDPFGIDKQA